MEYYQSVELIIIYTIYEIDMRRNHEIDTIRLYK